MAPQERLARIDAFYRKWAAEHDEEYLGHDDFGDFVIYSTKKPKLFGGILELRCDNKHLKMRDERYLSCIRMLDPLLLSESAVGAGDVLYLEKHQMLDECRRAAAEPPKEAEC